MGLELWENIFFYLGLSLDIKAIGYGIVLNICTKKYKKEIKQTLRQKKKCGNRKKAKELFEQVKEQFQYFRVEAIKVVVFPIQNFLYIA